MSQTLAKLKLLGHPRYKNAILTIDTDHGSYQLDVSHYTSIINPEIFLGFLQQLDGNQTVQEIMDKLSSEEHKSALLEVIQTLDEYGLVEEIPDPTNFKSGLEVCFEVEETILSALEETVYKNPFWVKMDELGADYPQSVLYGFAIENYHLLFREANFDSPILSYQSSTKARLLMNEFYVEEIGHDNLILKSLEKIGFTKAKLMDRMPLPGTMMMCNTLAHWGATDPLLFFSTLGLLEGSSFREDLQLDSYIDTCEKAGLDKEFIKYIKIHAQINLDSNHGSLTREMFQEIDYIDKETVEKLKSKIKLFVEIYNAFYQDIWDFYSKNYDISRAVTFSDLRD